MNFIDEIRKAEQEAEQIIKSAEEEAIELKNKTQITENKNLENLNRELKKALEEQIRKAEDEAKQFVTKAQQKGQEEAQKIKIGKDLSSTIDNVISILSNS